MQAAVDPARRARRHPARDRDGPHRLPGARQRPPDLALLAPRRGRHRVVARARRRLLGPAPPVRPDMTAGIRRETRRARAGSADGPPRSGRTAARRPTGRSPRPTAGRRSRAPSPPTSGATSSWPTSSSSRPGWVPATRPSEPSTRASSSSPPASSTRSAATPPGVEKNFLGARQRLPAGVAAGPAFGPRCRGDPGLELEAQPGRRGRRVAPRRLSRSAAPEVSVPLMQPRPTPTVDVREADRRRDEAGGGRPAPRGRPRADRVRRAPRRGRPPLPALDVHGPPRRAAARPAAADDLPLRARRSGAGHRASCSPTAGPDVANVAGGTLAWEAAGLPVRRGHARRPARATSAADGTGGRRETGGAGSELDAAATLRGLARPAAPPSAAARTSPGPCSLWANAQPMNSRMTKFTVAGAGGAQVAQLLADLALDLEGRHDDADEAGLEERLLRREVGRDRHPVAPRPPSVRRATTTLGADDDGRRALEAGLEVASGRGASSPAASRRRWAPTSRARREARSRRRRRRRRGCRWP